MFVVSVEQGAKKDLWSQEVLCCKHCSQELEKKETVCQDLKRELETARKHLHLSVREQRAMSEQVQGKDGESERKAMNVLA